MRPDEALAFLKKGAAQIISEAELREKLALGRPLRVKLGVDPTTADIHLGHAVVLRKLRQFQDVGHQAVLIIGDFTGMIGDPSGRSATRPHLTHKEVMHNAQSYREQAFKILDPARTETVCNGDWFRSMSYEDVLRLNSRVTLQQMLQREDFRGRIDNQQAIHAHEIQYPIMQGWDSVMVRADVELGGTDQLFNILVGRGFQKEEGMPQQIVFLLPILEGLDGSKKMSKSLGNFVGVSEPPTDMFGKLMSISDKLMVRYYEVLLGREIPKGADRSEIKKHAAEASCFSWRSALETLRGGSGLKQRQNRHTFNVGGGDAFKVRANAAQFRIHKCIDEVQALIEPSEEPILYPIVDRERDLGAGRPDLGEVDQPHHFDISAR